MMKLQNRMSRTIWFNSIGAAGDPCVNMVNKPGFANSRDGRTSKEIVSGHIAPYKDW